MTAIQLIFAVFVLQIIVYFLLDQFNFKKIKAIVLILILILHLFFLPSYFISDANNKEPRCGLLATSVIGVFWLFGISLTFIAHLLYWLYSRSKS